MKKRLLRRVEDICDGDIFIETFDLSTKEYSDVIININSPQFDQLLGKKESAPKLPEGLESAIPLNSADDVRYDFQLDVLNRLEALESAKESQNNQKLDSCIKEFSEWIVPFFNINCDPIYNQYTISEFQRGLNHIVELAKKASK